MCCSGALTKVSNIVSACRNWLQPRLVVPMFHSALCGGSHSGPFSLAIAFESSFVCLQESTMTTGKIRMTITRGTRFRGCFHCKLDLQGLDGGLDGAWRSRKGVQLSIASRPLGLEGTFQIWEVTDKVSKVKWMSELINGGTEDWLGVIDIPITSILTS